jgi:hypothetical protein
MRRALRKVPERSLNKHVDDTDVDGGGLPWPSSYLLLASGL